MIAHVQTGFTPLFVADAARAAFAVHKRVVLVCADDAAAQALADALPHFAETITLLRFPAWDCLPYDRASPSARVSAERMAALAALQQPLDAPQVLLTTAAALAQRTLTPFRVRQLTAVLQTGKRMERARLLSLLASLGYTRVETVTESGEFAVRGALIDLFPSGADYALRLDFFGDELESIRQFDSGDQRTIAKLERFTLLPACEVVLDEVRVKSFRTRYRALFGATATGDPLYQALSESRRLAGCEHWLPLFEERLEPLLVHIEHALWLADSGAEAALHARFDAITDYHGNRVSAMTQEIGSYRPLAPDALYITAQDWAAMQAALPVHSLAAYRQHGQDDAGGAVQEQAQVSAHWPVLDCAISPPRDFSLERNQGVNIYAALVDYAEQQAAATPPRATLIACYSHGSRERLRGLLQEQKGKTGLAESWAEALAGCTQAAQSHTILLLILPLDHGFTTPDYALISEQDMLGDRLMRKPKRRKSADAFMQQISALRVGDLIVHLEHGIGRYEGLMQIPVAQAPHDCVALTYAGGDKLFVPVENLDVLSRYGSESEGVALDKLGGLGWSTRKAKLKQRIQEIAGELIATAALRALKSAPIAAAEAGYSAFANAFPYQETEDQERAIEDVLTDLEAGSPMDRLVCGDVGFGKTEVALRAAYIAAHAGLQVALICPTTLLARQHYTTFEARFKGTAARIGRLSRLVPAAEAKLTKAGLAEGSVDIVIGTHALLAKGLEFKRLGLVIVDEEQRFGVVHKERLKALKTDVHMLTLTATPIPRTLQMALGGLRDLSVIQTPPVDRLAVRTYVAPFDPVVLREALLREHYRGGQSYFVVPRISDLPEVEEFLHKNVPEISYIVGHGQMTPSEVEERMSAFYDKRYDVLLATTIVESGLDIPSANTIIIHRADKFGLAQLYQLRGRVGRSKTRAYAYLTTHKRGFMTETAQKRLSVLSSLDTLGAGFQLASYDLDIRGAGNLLGDEQSGHIREVGFELYQSLLEEAIEDARAGAVRAPSTRDLSPQISVDAPVLIPEDYVPDLDMRMSLYRRVNEVENVADLEPLAAELIDRFGALPKPIQNLLTLIEVKLNARTAHIAKLDVGPRGALVSFWNDSFPNLPGLLNYVEKLKGTARLRPDSRFVLERAWGSPEARLHGILQLSRGLAKTAQV